MERKINEEIKESIIILISEDGKNLGKFDRNFAIKRARDNNLDLVKINNDQIPVCKIMDYGKLRYEQEKRNKQKHTHNSVTKEMRIGMNTDTHDIEFKNKIVSDFLKKGYHVTYSLKIKKFEKRIHTSDEFVNKLKNAVSCFSDVAKVGDPKVFEKEVNITLLPK